MIQEKEIRKGNAISYNGDIAFVSSIGEYGITAKAEDVIIKAKYDATHLHPILLAEEILLKCGFERENCTWKKGWIELWFSSYANSYQMRLHKVGSITEKNVDLKYVHQLQNLYFALTGEELDVKL